MYVTEIIGALMCSLCNKVDRTQSCWFFFTQYIHLSIIEYILVKHLSMTQVYIHISSHEKTYYHFIYEKHNV